MSYKQQISRASELARRVGGLDLMQGRVSVDTVLELAQKGLESHDEIEALELRVSEAILALRRGTAPLSARELCAVLILEKS